MYMDQKELVSRRDFFKKIKLKVLPIFALTIFSSPILSPTVKAKAPSGCYLGTCYIGCVMSCGGSCLNSCYTSWSVNVQ